MLKILIFCQKFMLFCIFLPIFYIFLHINFLKYYKIYQSLQFANLKVCSDFIIINIVYYINKKGKNSPTLEMWKNKKNYTQIYPHFSNTKYGNLLGIFRQFFSIFCGLKKLYTFPQPL